MIPSVLSDLCEESSVTRNNNAVLIMYALLIKICIGCIYQLAYCHFKDLFTPCVFLVRRIAASFVTGFQCLFKMIISKELFHFRERQFV